MLDRYKKFIKKKKKKKKKKSKNHWLYLYQLYIYNLIIIHTCEWGEPHMHAMIGRWNKAKLANLDGSDAPLVMKSTQEICSLILLIISQLSSCRLHQVQASTFIQWLKVHSKTVLTHRTIRTACFDDLDPKSKYPHL